MAKETILVDLDRCVGCWSCALSCRMAYDLDEYRCYIQTIGSGGIDEPIGTWPDLYMSWVPKFTDKCTLCMDRKADGERAFCEWVCPTKAIYHGDIEDPESAICKKREELRGRGYRELTMPTWEVGLSKNVIYYKKDKQ